MVLKGIPRGRGVSTNPTAFVLVAVVGRGPAETGDKCLRNLGEGGLTPIITGDSGDDVRMGLLVLDESGILSG